MLEIVVEVMSTYTHKNVPFTGGSEGRTTRIDSSTYDEDADTHVSRLRDVPELQTCASNLVAVLSLHVSYDQSLLPKPLHDSATPQRALEIVLTSTTSIFSLSFAACRVCTRTCVRARSAS